MSPTRQPAWSASDEPGPQEPAATPGAWPLTPVHRTALLLLLLQQRRWQLPELADHLGVSAAQLRRDLADVRRAGWEVQEEQVALGRGVGRPKAVWIGEVGGGG